MLGRVVVEFTSGCGFCSKQNANERWEMISVADRKKLLTFIFHVFERIAFQCLHS